MTDASDGQKSAWFTAGAGSPFAPGIEIFAEQITLAACQHATRRRAEPISYSANISFVGNRRADLIGKACQSGSRF